MPGIDPASKDRVAEILVEGGKLRRIYPTRFYKIDCCARFENELLLVLILN